MEHNLIHEHFSENMEKKPRIYRKKGQKLHCDNKVERKYIKNEPLTFHDLIFFFIGLPLTLLVFYILSDIEDVIRYIFKKLSR